MIMQIDEFFRSHQLPLKDQTIVIATSGGPDSMALLDLFYSSQKKYHYRLVAAHLDHGLRADSGQEIKVIEQYCRSKKIKVVNGVWPQALHPLQGVEAAARQYRYAFLTRIVEEQGAAYLVTAHHCDDLLENILLKFIRSGNPSEMNSLHAVSRMHGKLLLRPLLSFEKKTLLSYVEEKKIPYVIDCTNEDDEVLRNRLRHHLIPLLKQENPVIGQNALRFSQQLMVMSDLASQNLAQIKQPEPFLNVAYRLERMVLAHMPVEQQTAYWQQFIWKNWHVRVNEQLGHFQLLSYQNYFYLLANNLPRPTQRFSVTTGQSFVFNKRKLRLTSAVEENRPLIGRFYAPINAQLTAGSLKQGAKLLLKTGEHVKSKKKFAASAIPSALRPFCLTIYADDQPVFVEKTYTNQQVASDFQQYYLYDHI